MEDWREIDEVINCNIYRERKKIDEAYGVTYI